jgi:peptidoglycan/xylan/chitin deacetylase (PgdA/CDA1 family)
VHPDDFAWQMDDLSRRGYRTLTLDEYYAGLDRNGDAGRAFLLTFDDAYSHVDDAVTPILHRLSFSAVLFAPCAHLGESNTWDVDHPTLARMQISSPEQLRSMSAGPWEVASHGLRHVNLSTLEPGQRGADLRSAREHLSALIGKPVLDLAYPFGVASRPVRADAREAGYRMAFVAGPADGGDRFQLARRPIRGSDSRAVFRMKTSNWADWVYRRGHRAPDWARSTARTLLRIGTTAPGH